MLVVPRNKRAHLAGWQPGADLDILQQRAALLSRIRSYFEQQDVLEVETPVLSRAAAPDPALGSFLSAYNGPGLPGNTPLYLHTSPEFFMKRLLAAGSGSIYQVAHVFRNNESGSRHNPEFTLLEWYRVGFSYQQLMDDIEALLKACCSPELLAPIRRITYQELFEEFASVDAFNADITELKDCINSHGHMLSAADSESRRFWLDLILTHVIEPQIQQGAFFIFDYPADQAALAQVRNDNPPVAERFELYVNGIELANGFQELASATEQRQRFEAENRCRSELGLEQVPMDELFLQALASGLPDCAGVAIGIDRLVMLQTGQQQIDQVMAFSLSRV